MPYVLISMHFFEHEYKHMNKNVINKNGTYLRVYKYIRVKTRVYKYILKH